MEVSNLDDHNNPHSYVNPLGGAYSNPSILYPVRWNQVWPPQAPPGSLDRAARDFALRGLFDYLQEVVFRRTGRGDELIEFQIKRCNMFVEQPESEIRLQFPAVAVLPGNSAPSSPWLGPPTIIESTWNVYGKDTVLVQPYELYEEVVLDFWFDTRAQRRAVLAGLEGGALTTNQGPLYLVLEDYYDRVVVFEYLGARRFDGDAAIKNRREVQVTLSMRVEVVFPVLTRALNPHLTVETK